MSRINYSEKITQFFQDMLSRITGFLTRNQPESFVQRLQLTLLVITVLLVTFALSYPNLKQPQIDLSEDGPFIVGNNAPEDLVAVTDIEFLRENSYELARKSAASKASLYFTRDYGLLRADMQYSKETITLQKMLGNDIEKLQKCRASGGWDEIRSCALSSDRWRRLNKKEFISLASLSSERREELIRQSVNLIFPEFVILKKAPEGEARHLIENATGETVMVSSRNHASSSKPIQLKKSRVLRPVGLYNRDAQTFIRETIDVHLAGISKEQRSALRKMSVRYLATLDAANLDIEKTRAEQSRVIGNVERTEHTYKVKRGQYILKKGDNITEEMRRSLEIHQEKRVWEIVKRILSIFLQQIILTALMLYFAMRFAKNQIRDVSSNLIIFITLWLFALLLVLLERLWAARANEFEVSHFFGAWMPIGIFVVLLAIIFGERLTIPLALYLSFLVFIASKYDGLSLMISLLVGLTGTILGARVERRVQFITTAMMLTFLNVLMVMAGYLYSNRPIMGMTLGEGIFSDGFEKAVLVAFSSGLTTIVVIGLLPIYETIFNIPTRFKLQELADPSHPLLKELFQRAPSTWTHTLMVAALSEKASERLHLNTMLIRTGIYFHDIGKMGNAGFFIENQHLIPREENIDKDQPHKAARVIIDHVLDGIKMAEKYRLPREVIAFIPEHHGTSTMAFFYHKALEKMKRRVRREDFRYPGPRPRSKETGIAMIADSVEAASRSLEVITEDSLNQMIQKIINIKLAENQLDESNLTIGDLTIIKESFKDVLISSYHSRPRYPDQADTKRLEENQRIRKKNTRKNLKKKPSRSKKKVRL